MPEGSSMSFQCEWERERDRNKWATQNLWLNMQYAALHILVYSCTTIKYNSCTKDQYKSVRFDKLLTSKVCNIHTINYRPYCPWKAILFIVYSLPYDSLTPITNCESNASPFLSACTNFMAESCKRCLISQKMLWFQLSSISYNDKITVTSVLLNQLFLTNGIWTSRGCGHFVTSMWKFLLHVVNILYCILYLSILLISDLSIIIILYNTTAHFQEFLMYKC